MATRPTGAEEGKAFEAIFVRQALSNGLLPKKNDLSAKFLRGRRLQVLKSDLDYRLITAEGRVGYFDCKSYDDDRFAYSALSPDQIERAAEYNRWKVPAGFVVWLRKTGRVFFYSGGLVATSGPGNSFGESTIGGVLLGGYTGFDLKLLFIRGV